MVRSREVGLVPVTQEDPSLPLASSKTELLRELGLRDGISLVVGCVIGSGIFLVPNSIAKQLPAFSYVALLWIAGGLLTLCGALALGELGAVFPQAGGLYVYLREAYGRPVAFLYGWGLLTLIHSGTIATLGVAFRIYLSQIADLTGLQEKLSGVLCIVVLAALNLIGLRAGKHVQNVITLAKVGGLALLIGILFARGHVQQLQISFWPTPNEKFRIASFGTALIAVLWAYEGWHVVSFTASEFRHPRRDLPLGLFYGTAIVGSIYLLANVGYYSVLSPAQIERTQRVAATAITAAAGSRATLFITALIIVSIIGAMNGMILTGPRVYYAMAKEGLFFRSFGTVHPGTHVPMSAIIVQGIWAAALTLLGTFQELFTYVIFTAWIFYSLSVAAVIVLRIRRPEIIRPFKVPLYPWLNALFILAGIGVAVSAIISSPIRALYGIGLILAGLPIYAIFLVANRITRTDPPRPAHP
jgi:basic amino acid/polyamine antiporter, APA family